jgi:hypothetical protein
MGEGGNVWNITGGNNQNIATAQPKPISQWIVTGTGE